MAKFYYNGVLLPEIPAEKFAAYPNQMILKWPNGNIKLVGSKNGLYFNGNTGAYDKGSTTLLAYYLNKDAWVEDVNQSGKYTGWTIMSNGVSVLHWSNHNIPNGSASASTVYFYRSSPIPYYDEGYLKTSARAYHAASSTTPLSISIEASAGDMMVIGIAARSEFAVPDGFSKCFTSDPCGTQTLSMVYKTVTEDGLQTVAFPGTEGALTYLTAMVFRNIKKVKYTGQQYYYFADAGTSTFSKAIRKRKDGVCTLWGITCNYALNYSESTPYDYSASPDDMEGIQSQDPLLNNVRLKMFFDDGTGSMDHTISYPMKGAYNYAIDAIELYPYDMRYLVRSGYNLYTVADGALMALTETEVTASLFQTYGADDLPDGALLATLTDPEVLYWQDSENELPTLSLTVKGTPPLPQMFTSDPMDLTHESIAGIDHATVDASEDVRFAISFDDGSTWKAFDGSAWFAVSDTAPGMLPSTMNAITAEQWEEVVQLTAYRLRFWLPNVTAFVKSVVMHYINP